MSNDYERMGFDYVGPMPLVTYGGTIEVKRAGLTYIFNEHGRWIETRLNRTPMTEKEILDAISARHGQASGLANPRC
jgi:hypothetical protein